MIRGEHLVSYLAGIFDGEGCVSIGKFKLHAGRKSADYRVEVTVALADKIVPILFHSRYGGNLHKHSNGRNSPSHWKVVWRWLIDGKRALPFLREMLPLSLVKAPQIQVAIHLLENFRSKGWMTQLTETEVALREADYILCRALKKQSISSLDDLCRGNGHIPPIITMEQYCSVKSDGERE